MKTFQEIQRNVRNEKEFQTELKRKRDYIVSWIDSKKFVDIMPLCVELKQARGGLRAYSTLYSALIGGEYEGESYDGLDPTYEELTEAIKYCIEDDTASIRSAIKAIRRTEKLGDEYSKF